MNVYAIPWAALLALVLTAAPLQAENTRTLRLSVGQDVVLIDLLDNPAAKALAAQLPLTVTFKDYAGSEKIATLPARLPSQGSPSGREAAVDFAYFVPWGNLALFYKGVGDDGQLLSLGRIRSGKDILGKHHNNFTATLELLPH